jgi:hypothetical protein
MNSHGMTCLRTLLIAWTLCWTLGCGSKQYPVDENRAQTTLQSVLDSWKHGQTPADLKGQSDPIVVQDPDWEKGVKLKEYQIVEVGAPEGPNLRCVVELVLEDASGKAVTNNVRYCITTSPNVTVFRDLF